MRKDDKIKPNYLDGKWYIEVDTKELGEVFLLKENEELPIPVTFDTKEQAQKYIDFYKEKHSLTL